MPEQNKTRRFFDLIRWLQKEGQTGISKQRIIAEYGISEKTFTRDIEELEEILPKTIRYDHDDQRIFASLFNPGLESKQTGVEVSPKLPLGATGQSPPGENTLFHQPQNTLKIKVREYEDLMSAVIESASIDFTYRGKRRTGIPLFFCYYAERWYVFMWLQENDLIYKFRLDQFQQVLRPLIPSGQQPLSLGDRRKEASEKIRRSHNIFVDVNASEKLTIHFRFFFSADYLKEELGSYENLEPVEVENTKSKEVTDVQISFLGYQEAQIFMNKWLGHFQILKPEAIRVRYLNELEEAMDII